MQRFKDLVEKEVAEAFRKVKATILQETSEGSVEIRKHYARIPAEAVIVELMQKFRLLMSLFTPDSRAERKHHDQLTAAVTQFLNVCTKRITTMYPTYCQPVLAGSLSQCVLSLSVSKYTSILCQLCQILDLSASWCK